MDSLPRSTALNFYSFFHSAQGKHPNSVCMERLYVRGAKMSSRTGKQLKIKGGVTEEACSPPSHLRARPALVPSSSSARSLTRVSPPTRHPARYAEPGQEVVMAKRSAKLATKDKEERPSFARRTHIENSFRSKSHATPRHRLAPGDLADFMRLSPREGTRIRLPQPAGYCNSEPTVEYHPGRGSHRLLQRQGRQVGKSREVHPQGTCGGYHSHRRQDHRPVSAVEGSSFSMADVRCICLVCGRAVSAQSTRAPRTSVAA